MQIRQPSFNEAAAESCCGMLARAHAVVLDLVLQ